MQKVDLKLLDDIIPAALPAPVRVSRYNGGGTVLSPALSQILKETQRELGYEQGGNPELYAESELSSLISRVALRLGLDLSTYEKEVILEQIEREQKPFGLLQELVDDREVSDIIVTDFSKVTVQKGRLNYSTDFVFPSSEAYENYIERLLQKAGSTYSTKKPIADGMIGSFARIHVVHKSLCESGPYLTIRLNRFSSVKVSDLSRHGTAPEPLLDYLVALIRSGATVLIVGEVGTGKTTLARALASGIPANESILVIEDTPEIRLEHPHVRYVATREANSDGAGRISPSECIRGGMRMAMNRIIFGEIRDAEAAEAFIDVCASGHPGLSTIHAKSASEALTRLELFLGRAQKGVMRGVLNEQIVTAVQAIVYIDICKVSGKRRVMEVKEIGPVADGIIRQRDIFRYKLSPEGLPQWRLINKVSSYREEIEKGENAMRLSDLPSTIDLEFEALYKEAGYELDQNQDD